MSSPPVPALPPLRRAPKWSPLSALSLVVLFVSGACRPLGGTCDDTGRCTCFDEPECFISCGSSACDVSCGQVAEACGVVCGDDCALECNDTNHCSSSSGERSQIHCHNLPSCASSCGASCDYRCNDVSECYPSVGPESQVECDHTALCETTCEGDCDVSCQDVSRCLVECTGPCEVNLSCNQVATCQVSCADDLEYTQAGGVHRCM